MKSLGFLFLTFSLALVHLSVPTALSYEPDESELDLPAFVASTDGYARQFVDTCLRESIGEPEHDGMIILYFGEDTSGEEGAAVAGQAPQPCCACGSKLPGFPWDGCFTYMKPCCCQATISPGGTLSCACDAGACRSTLVAAGGGV